MKNRVAAAFKTNCKQPLETPYEVFGGLPYLYGTGSYKNSFAILIAIHRKPQTRRAIEDSTGLYGETAQPQSQYEGLRE